MQDYIDQKLAKLRYDWKQHPDHRDVIEMQAKILEWAKQAKKPEKRDQTFEEFVEDAML